MDSMIAKLRVALQLDSAAFESGAKRAAAEVNTLGSRAEKAGFAIGRMGKAIAIGGAALAAGSIVSGLKEAVTSSLDYAASLGETAQQLGVTTKSLQEYRYAASQVGISQEEMDNGLAKLTKTIGQAALGGAKQASTFEKLGISIRDSNGKIKDAGDLIPEIAEALSKLGSTAERSAISYELFGKGAAKMGSLMADGANGVNKLRDAAKGLGIVMSDELIAKADAAADKMSELDTVMKAKVAISVANNTEGVLALANAYAFLTDKLLGVIGLMGRMADIAAKNNAGLKDYFNNSGALGGLAKELAARPGFAGIFGNLPPASAGGSPAPAAKPSAPGNWGAQPFGGPMVKNAGSFKQGGGGLLTKFGGSGFALPGAANDFASMTPGKQTEISKSVLLNAEQIQAAFLKVTDATDAASTDTAVATVKIGKSFGDMAQQTIGSLQSLASSIKGGDFLSILGSVVGLFTQLGKVGAFGSAISTRLNTIEPRASGGPVNANSLYMVGERGPELFVPSGGGTIVPNHALGGSRGGRSGGNTYHFQGNLMTPEFWAMIQQGNQSAAQAGGEIGFGKVARAGSRSLSR